MGATMKTFSKRLHERRKEMGMTVKELAEEVGYLPATIYRWEENGSVPRIETLFWLAQALEVSSDWLIGLTDDKRDDE